MSGVAGPKQLRRLLDAVMAVGSALDLPLVLQRVLEAAVELAGARFGALGVLDETRTRLAEFLTVGLDDEARAAIGNLPEGHGILGLLIVEPKALRLPDIGEHPDSFGFPPHHPEMTSFLGVPILIRDQAFGNLYLTNKFDGETFTDVDEELVVALAAAAGIAIENARLHAQVAELALLEDRERIARDLHDTVIQRLFATGLTLQGAAGLTHEAKAAGRIQRAVDDIDTTVREIRSVIFELSTARLPGRSVRQEILDVGSEATGALGFDPQVRFDGPIDAAVGADTADHLVATLREALANVARHAAATSVHVEVASADGWLELAVADNGRGTDQPERAGGHGVANMRARADRLGGIFELAAPTEGGTLVRWRVPLKTPSG